ncbi:hypothetical protein H5J25_13460 [Sphingomonas aliaeris]|uniref:Uncharacterized protein n=1 Tax=Sphingomonas aliaeris TaxID=2759526 RepID=A0A974S3X1_9SPHN|nr:hypothetical protein [Sphingomonas aliaeris]QQV76465.1 hypothetical protein H5J25_13460 [Sphingomonas aliaeris]
MFVGYLFSARLGYLASAEWKRHPSRKRRGITTMRQERVVWTGIAIALAVGAFYRQLDLQNLISGIGRQIAKEAMLYNGRQSYQAIVVCIIGVVILAAAVLLLGCLRRIDSLALIALTALLILVTMQVLKTISSHQIDAIFQAGFGGINTYNLAEAASLFTICLAAVLYRRESLVVKRG